MPQLLIVKLWLVDEAYLRTYIREKYLYYNYKTSNSFYAFTFFHLYLKFYVHFFFIMMWSFSFFNMEAILVYSMRNQDSKVWSSNASRLFHKPAVTGSTRSILLHASINLGSSCRETTYRLVPSSGVRQIGPLAFMTPFLDVDRHQKPIFTRSWRQGITTYVLYNGRLTETWRTDKSNQGGDGSRNNKMNR